VFHDTGFPFLDGLKDCANESGEDGGPRGDGKALAKTEEAPQALPEGIRSMTPEMLDFLKRVHVNFFPFETPSFYIDVFPDPFLHTNSRMSFQSVFDSLRGIVGYSLWRRKQSFSLNWVGREVLEYKENGLVLQFDVTYDVSGREIRFCEDLLFPLRGGEISVSDLDHPYPDSPKRVEIIANIKEALEKLGQIPISERAKRT